MTDIAEIAAIKARYCMAADLCTSDPAAARTAIAALVTADAVGDYGYGLLAGGEAVADFLTASIAASSVWMLHMLHTPLVAVEGNAATGDWTVMVHCKRRESQDIDTIVGRYSDTFRRDADGAWRIAHVHFIRNI